MSHADSHGHDQHHDHGHAEHGDQPHGFLNTVFDSSMGGFGIVWASLLLIIIFLLLLLS